MEETENLFDEEVNNSNDSPVDETSNVEQPEDNQDVTIEDEPIQSAGFSSKPKGSREYDKIQLEEAFPEEGMTLTIESVEAQQVYPKDETQTSQYGEYYKKKLILNFAEEFNDRKLREFLPSIFYRLEGNEVVPNFPKACTKEELTDNFVSKLAKFRYLYQTTFNVPEDQSDADFAAGLVGKKVHVKKHIGQWKDGGVTKKFASLVIDKFVLE